MLLYALPCKVKRAFPVFRIQVIEHLNQLFAASIRCVLIEKVELGHPLAEEVTQHYSGFLVTMVILPDFIQALYAALMILGKKKSDKKPGIAPGSVPILKKPLSTQSTILQHRFNPRIVPTPLAVKFS